MNLLETENLAGTLGAEEMLSMLEGLMAKLTGAGIGLCQAGGIPALGAGTDTSCDLLARALLDPYSCTLCIHPS